MRKIRDSFPRQFDLTLHDVRFQVFLNRHMEESWDSSIPSSQLNTFIDEYQFYLVEWSSNNSFNKSNRGSKTIPDPRDTILLLSGEKYRYFSQSRS